MWSICKGLKVKGLFSYDTSIADNSIFQKEYNEYTYDEASETYSAYPKQSPTKLERYYGNSWSTLWQASVSYDNTFATDHHVSGLLLYEEGHSVVIIFVLLVSSLYLCLICLPVIRLISLVHPMRMD